MPDETYIRIKNTEVEDSKKLTFRISFSKDLKKYFFRNQFYVKFDKSIRDIDNSVLNIPGVSGLIALSWVVDSKLYVNELDSYYLESLGKVKNVFKKFYPNLRLKGDIQVKNRDFNYYPSNKKGLLFSGGIDSTCSLLKRKENPPVLYSIIGGVIPSNNEEFIHNFKEVYTNLANIKKTKIHFIETNLRDLLNEPLLTYKFRNEINEWSWWEALNLALVQLSLCAPLSVKEVNQLIISSSNATKINWMPYGSDKLLDEKIGWANLRVTHDDYMIERQEKIRKILKPEILTNNLHQVLQVCNYYPIVSSDFNCGYCNKCAMTIIGLLTENIDPVKCGFPIVKDFFKHLKNDKLDREVLSGIWRYWKNIQDNLDPNVCNGLYDSKKFLKWFKKTRLIKLRDNKNRTNQETRMLKIQSMLPLSMQKVAFKAYLIWKYHKRKKVKVNVNPLT